MSPLLYMRLKMPGVRMISLLSADVLCQEVSDAPFVIIKLVDLPTTVNLLARGAVHSTVPQEVGNVPFVVNNGVGAYEEEPSKIAQIVASWLGPKADEFREMSSKAKKLAHPEAVFTIVRDLDALTLWPHTLDNVKFTV